MMTTKNSQEEIPASIVNYNRKLAEIYKRRTLKRKDESFIFLSEENRAHLEKSQNISLSFVNTKEREKEIHFNDKDLSIINKSINSSPNQKNRSFLNSFLEGIKL